MWQFPEHTSGVIEDPVQEAFFSDATDKRTAIHLVRESIQNSLDARSGDDPVRLRFTFGRLDIEMTREIYDGLDGHLRADGNGLKNPPGPHQELRYLAIEDFGTTGLKGDVNVTSITGATDDNDFFYFFRNVGRSGKGEGSLGSWGLGKQVFPASSEINTCFGLTRRADDPRMYLMGMCVLKHHERHGHHHTPYGHYAKWDGENPYPITDVSRIEQFRREFHLGRGDAEPGLSIVVPHVVEDFNPRMLEDQVIENYFWPILKGDLVIEIQSDHLTPPETVLTSESMRGIPLSRSVDRELADTIKLADQVLSGDVGTPICPRITEANRAARWDDVTPSDSDIAQLVEAAREGEPFAVSIKVPIWLDNGHKPWSWFEVYGQRVSYAVKRPSYFVRGDGISIPRACKQNPSDYVFLVVSSGSELSNMLKSAENPSHADFMNTNELKQSYHRGWPTIKFVRAAPGAIAKWLESEHLEEETGLFSDVFFKHVESASTNRRSRTRRNPRPSVVVERTPKRWEIRQTKDGFTVYDAGSNGALPQQVDVRVAYDAEVNDPFKAHSPLDFNLSTQSGQVAVSGSEGCTLEILGPNQIRLTDLKEGFNVSLSGFDTRRDIKTRVRSTSH